MVDFIPITLYDKISGDLFAKLQRVAISILYRLRLSKIMIEGGVPWKTTKQRLTLLKKQLNLLKLSHSTVMHTVELYAEYAAKHGKPINHMGCSGLDCLK